jgi:hypothetical protein
VTPTPPSRRRSRLPADRVDATTTLTPGGRKPGRKPKLDAKDRRIAELETRAARLEAKLSLAEKLLDLQKKVSAILGIKLGGDVES